MSVDWTCDRCGKEIGNDNYSRDRHKKECDPTDRLDEEQAELEEGLDRAHEQIDLLWAEIRLLKEALLKAGIPFPNP